MKKDFIQKTVVDLEFDDYNGYKTKLFKSKDLAPCLYFSPKSFEKYKENNSVNVVGFVKIKQKRYTDTANDNSTVLEMNEKASKGIKGICYFSTKSSINAAMFDIYENKPKNHYTIGYASVGNGEYIQLVKFNPFCIFLSVIIVLLIICGLLCCYNQENPFDIVNGNEITTEAPTYDDYLANNHYLYIWRTKTVTSDKPTVALANHPDNDVYLCYDIYKNDEKLDSTGAFAPNSQIDYNFYNLFQGNKGTYNLKLVIKVYDLETKDELCSKTMPVEIIIN